VEDEPAAVTEHDHAGRARERVHEGEVEAVVDDRALVGLAVVLVDPGEVALALALARVGLNDAHAADVLGQRP